MKKYIILKPSIDGNKVFTGFGKRGPKWSADKSKAVEFDSHKSAVEIARLIKAAVAERRQND